MFNFFEKTVSILILSAFMFFRVVNVHAVHHIFSDKDASHCKQCSLIAYTKKITPLDLVTSQIEYKIIEIFNWQQFLSGHEAFKKFALSISMPGRAPPIA